MMYNITINQQGTVMRKTAQVKKMLKDICTTADKKIYSINFGGCAVFAVILAEQLENCGYTDYKIRVYTNAYDGVNISNAEHKVHGNHNMIAWNQNRVDFAHVVVEWRGLLWNAGCVTPRKNGKRIGWFNRLQRGSISRTAMKVLADNQFGWNKEFDRKKNIPKLRRIVNKIVADHAMV